MEFNLFTDSVLRWSTWRSINKQELLLLLRKAAIPVTVIEVLKENVEGVKDLLLFCSFTEVMALERTT